MGYLYLFSVVVAVIPKCFLPVKVDVKLANTGFFGKELFKWSRGYFFHQVPGTINKHITGQVSITRAANTGKTTVNCYNKKMPECQQRYKNIPTTESYQFSSRVLIVNIGFQCFDTVGWAAKRASGM